MGALNPAHHVYTVALTVTYGAALAVAVTLANVPPSIAVLSVPMAAGLLAVSIIDQRAQRIPNLLSLLLGVAGIGATWWLAPGDVGDHILACSVGFLGLATVILLYRRLRGRDGMGWGDAKLFGAAGAWVGMAGLLTVLLWACLTALAVALVLHFAAGPMNRTSRVPFGPHLAFGTWLVWLFGPLI